MSIFTSSKEEQLIISIEIRKQKKYTKKDTTFNFAPCSKSHIRAGRELTQDIKEPELKAN